MTLKKKKQKREKEKERLTTEKGKWNSTTELLKLKKKQARLPQKLRAAELLYLLWQCFLVRFHPGLLEVVSVDELPQAPPPALLCQTTSKSSCNQ